MLRRFRARPIPPKMLLGLFLLFVLAVITWFAMKARSDTKVHDFDSCVAAGNPVLETFPEQCSHRGQSYFRPGQGPPSPF